MIFTLPLAIAVLWLFHRSVKFAVVKLLPACMQRRIVCTPDFPFGGARRFALLALSVLVGALTHLAWDSFTHPQSWLVEHWPLLREEIFLPWLRPYPVELCRVLHLLSTLAGTVILVIWILAWMRRTEPAQPLHSSLSSGSKLGIVLLMSALALYGGWLHGSIFHFRRHPEVSYLGLFVVTAVALLWWELVALGWWWQLQPLPRATVSQD